MTEASPRPLNSGPTPTGEYPAMGTDRPPKYWPNGRTRENAATSRSPVGPVTATRHRSSGPMDEIHFSWSVRGQLNERVSMSQAPTRSPSVGSRTSMAVGTGCHGTRPNPVPAPTFVAMPSDDRLLLTDYVERERERITTTLFDWLRIASISAQPEHA